MEAWLGFSWGDQVIPTNDALRESRGNLGIGWQQDDADMHVGKCLHGETSWLSTSQSTNTAEQCCSEIKSASLMINFARNKQLSLVYMNSNISVLQHSLMLHNIVQCTSVAQINLQQRAPWMLSIYSSWLRFLKGIRGFLRMPCSVFRGKGPFSPTGDCTAAIYPFLSIMQQR